MTLVDTFLPAMHDVAGCDRALRELNLTWRLIESSIKMSHPDAAGLILNTMASTREHFDQLEGELVTSLVREKLDTVLREIGTKAQYVIDIVVRNLYERTADVGFLATDPELSAFVAGSGADRAAIEDRLAAYRAKYTVYDAILLLDAGGAVLAQVGDGECAQRSTDPLVAQALASDAHVEAFRPSDLRPGKRRALLYAKRIVDPERGTVVGVLCLCFNFEEEMAGIFRSHRDAGARYNMLLLDGANRCIASADPDWVPVDALLPVNGEDTPGLFMYGGRQYLVRTFDAQGYQGYAGPPGWQGQVMIPLEVAFQHLALQRHAQLDPALREGLLTHAQRFCPPLHQILTAAETIRRVVWNGQVMTAGQRESGARLQPVLEQISETGQRSNELFANSIRDLYATVLSAGMQDSEFVSHLLVDLLDRNLYERADDCRWWALNPVLRSTLAGGPPDRAGVARMEEVLRTINRLYTVYTRIVVYDLEGTILAQSFREGPRVGDLREARIPAADLGRVVALGDEQGYVVSDFESSDLYGGQCTYVYHAAIRSADNARQVIGGIGLVFDSARELPAMLADGLAGKPDTCAWFVDRGGRVVAGSDDSRAVGSVLAIAPAMLALANGAGAADLVVHDGEYAIMGATASSGYREFKVSDGYREDIVAIVCQRFGAVRQGSAARRTPAAATALAGQSGGRKYATFYSAEALFALDVQHVREARPASGVTPVRIGSPPHSVGLLPVAAAGERDRTIWVFDLGAMVSGRPSEIGTHSEVVVVAHEGQQIGLLTERLHAVSSFDEAQLSDLPIRAEFDLVQAIVREPGGLVQLLDVDALFRLFREPERARTAAPAEVDLLDLEDADDQQVA